MPDLRSLLTPQSVAVVGACEDRETYGGRIWRYLRRDFPGTCLAVNRRKDAVRSTSCVSSLSELPLMPDVAVLAAPSQVVPELLREAGSLGIRAVIVLARESLGQEDQLRSIAAESEMLLLGPNCLGLIHGNASTPLSSSISLERPLSPGPFALVSQSGAFMGVLHARAADLGIGLGLCVSTGSQAQLWVEDFLAEIASMDAIRAVAAYMEDFDPPRFEAAARVLGEQGKTLVVLKGGVTQYGSRASAAHSRSLASDGHMFRTLAGELGAAIVDDQDELLAALLVSQTLGRKIFLVTISGGLAVTGSDHAYDLELDLSTPSSETERKLTALGMPLPHNPLDLEAAPSTPLGKAQAIAALIEDREADCVVVALSDLPDFAEVANQVALVATRAAGRLVVCSVCSEQSDDVWHRWVSSGLSYVDGLRTVLRAFASVHGEAAEASTEASGHLARQSTRRQVESGSAQMPPAGVLELLTQAGIRVVAQREVGSVEAALHAAEAVGYPVVLKVSQAAHRGSDGVRPGLETAGAVAAAYEELVNLGPDVDSLLVQPQATGLEFYVGVIRDPRFGLLLVVGRGGTNVDAPRDVAISQVPVTLEAARRLVDQTVVGQWLLGRPLPAASRPLFDSQSLADVAYRAAALAAGMGNEFVTLDLNPVVVGASDATVVDGKISLAVAQAPWESPGGVPSHSIATLSESLPEAVL